MSDILKVLEELDENSVQLTACQHNALQAIIDWSYDNNKLFYTLSGAAGTGKSFLIAQLKHKIKQRWGVGVSAPTHKAKNVIAKYTGLNDHTIQQLLGLAPDTDVEDFDVNNVKFDSKNEPKISEYRLLYIDEASMINKALFTLICKEARINNTKVLFIGDHLQLPPVGEEISPVFTEVKDISYLIEPARQKPSNPLTMYLLANRLDMEYTDTTFGYLINALNNFSIHKRIPDIIEQLQNSKGRMFKLLQTLLPDEYNKDTQEGVLFTQEPSKLDFCIRMVQDFGNSQFLDNTNYVKYVAFENANVYEYNKMIRGKIKEVTSQIQEGDLIMAYNTITEYPSNITILQNAEEYIIVSVQECENNYGVFGYFVNARNVSDNRPTEFFIASNKDNYELYIHFHSELRNNAIQDRRKWVAYYNFRKATLLQESLNKQSKLLPSKDLDFGYGITVHKSQGSTYQKVYVNAINIRNSYLKGVAALRANNTDTPDNIRKQQLFLFKLMYVALSRASKFVEVLI